MKLCFVIAAQAAVCLLWGCRSMQPAGPTRLPLIAATAAFDAQTAPTATATPFESPPPAQGCYYVWATHELPEVSSELQTQLADAGRVVDVRAYAFGEDCRMESGDTTFHPMETDFRLSMRVDTTTNEEALGEAIEAAMAAIEGLPPGLIQGPQPGRVEFEFVAPGSELVRLNIEIVRFRLEAAGLKGAALFRHFQGDS